MYWERKKIEPNIPKYMLSDTTFVTAKERRAKNSIGSIGSRARSSQPTNAPSSSDAGDQAGEHASLRPAERLRAHEPEDDAERARGAEHQPGEVQRAVRAVALAQHARRQRARSTSPIGTLIQKIQCQEMLCTTAPPTSGPSATAMPLMPDHTPIAMPRRARPGTPPRAASASAA